MNPRVTAIVVGLLCLGLTVFGFAVSPVIGIVFAICTLPAVLVTGLRAGMTERDAQRQGHAPPDGRRGPAPTRRTGAPQGRRGGAGGRDVRR